MAGEIRFYLEESALSARKYDSVILDLYGTLIDLPGTQEQERARMASALGIEGDRFREAWRRFRLQRHKGLSTVEEAIVVTVDNLGIEVESDAIRAAKAARYQSKLAQLAPRPSEVYKRYRDLSEGRSVLLTRW